MVYNKLIIIRVKYFYIIRIWVTLSRVGGSELTSRSPSTAAHRSQESSAYTPSKNSQPELHFLLDLLNQFTFLDDFFANEWRQYDFLRHKIVKI